MKKKIFNFFIIFILVFSIFTPVSANRETIEKNKNSKKIIIIPIENYPDKESFETKMENILNANNSEFYKNKYNKTKLENASISNIQKNINIRFYPGLLGIK
ncbi:MAG: hypothetical protein PUG84_01340 [Peptoniphilaceae bacterium]|uniref:hypothetical protein n=1 Tax=Peptoniphilus sp. TaxID=1971214 RepID=UPI0029794B2B|nr:hypothetical protein [Peptoniphilus sp.]MDD7352082.1 hypothetical protein [Peptoniphilaceae bacterium]MDY3902672.1 hypothetical protein [Peptoniphilus sp.]